MEGTTPSSRNWALGLPLLEQDSRGLGATGAFSSNGSPPNQNNYLLDGVDNNSNLVDYFNGSYYIYLPSVDALQEFKVQTSNFNAEFSRAGGAVLNATTKSGTDKFHGNVFEFLRNDALDARNYFEQSKGEFRLNQFGVTAGGPVFIPYLWDGRKHKTYVFGDYQGSRIVQATPYTSTVPTALERSSGYTNLSELVSGQSGTRTDLLGRTFPLGQVFDPSTTRAVTAGQVDPVTGLTATANGYAREPFAQNQIPAGRLDANAVNLLGVFPAPNLPGLFNNYASDPHFTDQNDQGDIRIDQVTGTRGQVFGRFSYGREPTLIPPPFSTVANGGAFSSGNQVLDTKNFVLGWTFLFSPTVVNEARAGYSRIGASRVQPFASDLSIPSQFGIQGIPAAPNNGGLPTYNLTGLTQLGASPWLPSSETGRVQQVTENISKIAGKHSFKGGFEFQLSNISFFQPAYSRGNFNYTGVYTEVAPTTGGNTGLAQLALTPIAGTVPGALNNVGGADGVSASNIANTSVTRNVYGYYGQDDWKISSRLTLNLGLRYEFNGHGVSPGGMQANFIPPTGGRGAEYLMKTQTCNQNLSASFIALTAKDGIAITCSSVPSLLANNWDDFAPRVGFAYQAIKGTVLRGAYGIFYGAPSYGDNLASTAINYPFSYTFTYNSPDAGQPVSYPTGAIATLENGLSALSFNSTNVNATGLSLGGMQYNFRTAYFQDFNLTLEQEISPSMTATIGYIGNQGRHILVNSSTNNVSELLPPSVNPQNYVPYPDFSRGFGRKESAGNGSYNSLQATLQRRVASGLNLLAAYTWSKCRTDTQDLLNNSAGNYRAPDLPGFGIHGDYGKCNWDVAQMFHASGTYELPFGRNRLLLANSPAVLNAVVGNWTTNAIVTEQSGQPFTVSCTIATAASLGCYAPTVFGEGIYAGQHNANQWMNPAAFTNPAPVTTIGQPGYAPLGGAPTQVDGPGFHRIDFSVFKQIPIHEDLRAEFRVEIFNLLNTPQFSIPGFSGPGIAAAPGSLDFTNTANFGKITSTRDGAYDQREVQLALKIYW
jgi:hypothetical protein